MEMYLENSRRSEYTQQKKAPYSGIYINSDEEKY